MLLPERFLADAYLEQRAAALLRAARSDGCWDGRPPVPVELVAERLCDLRLGWLALGSADDGVRTLAALIAEQRAVYLNEDARDLFEMYPGLERFTWAHELGHFVLHVDPAVSLQQRLPLSDSTPTVLCRENGKSRRELQADRFASLFLMPSDLIRNRLDTIDTRLWPPLYQLRNEFGVSISAMVIRVRRLGRPTPAGS